jgi:hypothetical protein
MATWPVKPSTFRSMFRAQGFGNPNLQHEGLKSTKSWQAISTASSERGAPQTSKWFDALMKGAGDEAREVLETFRDNHPFDPEKILAAELHIALDENSLPIEPSGNASQTAEHEGTLDVVMIHSLTEAEIDWKSYYQVIDADTFQSKFYPLP